MVSKESGLQDTHENERVQGHLDVEFLKIRENLGERHPLSQCKPFLFCRLPQGYFVQQL